MENKIDKDMKRMWSCMVGKWVGINKNNKVHVIDKYLDQNYN